MQVFLDTEAKILSALSGWSLADSRIFYTATTEAQPRITSLGLPVAEIVITITADQFSEADLLSVRPQAIRVQNGTQIICC